MYWIVLVIGLGDELKYLLQWKKLRKTQKHAAVSRAMMLFSLFAKFVVFCYASAQQQWMFSFFYAVGMLTTAVVIQHLYKCCNIKNKTWIKFIAKSFHINSFHEHMLN